jgi:hypothetical protein
VRPGDFFLTVIEPATDIFGFELGSESEGNVSTRFDVELVEQLRRGPVPPRADTEMAVALALLIDSELQAYGTDGNGRLDNEEMRQSLIALRAVLLRLGVEVAGFPFRDLTTFRSWWMRRGASGPGGWQARRNLVHEVFEPIHDALTDMEQREMSSQLVDPISPHQRTGWPRVDAEISELRRHFNAATTPQDYRAVGLGCVAVLDAVSAAAYDPAIHLREGEAEPPVDNTKNRLERVVEDALPGRDNAALRKHARALIEFAQEVKHSSTPTRRDAGIAADGVIQLANVMRRLRELL